MFRLRRDRFKVQVLPKEPPQSGRHHDRATASNVPRGPQRRSFEVRPSKLRFIIIKRVQVEIFSFKKTKMETKELETESRTECKLDILNKSCNENKNQAGLGSFCESAF